MKRSNLLAILTISLFLSSSIFILTPVQVRAASSGVVAVDYYHQVVGNQTIYRAYGIPPAYSDQKADLANTWGNLTKLGYTVNLQLLNKTTPISSSDLSGVSVLILGQLSSLNMNYSQSEVNAIAGWFQTGNKLLLMSGQSNYGCNCSWTASVPNGIMKAIGSQLRLDLGEVTDQPGVGASGSGFRIYASSANNGINTADWAGTLTANTQKVRFHGTGNIIGYTGGKYVSFDSLTGTTVTWLYRTSPQGVDTAQGNIPSYVTPYDTPGQWVLAAAEKIPEGGVYSKVVLAGAGFIGSYTISASTEFGYNVQFQGLQFVLNAVNWGTTSESVPSSYDWTLIIGAVVVVIIIIAAAALYMMRRKPTAKPMATPAPAS
jgi:hypothetical protein